MALSLLNRSVFMRSQWVRFTARHHLRLISSTEGKNPAERELPKDKQPEKTLLGNTYRPTPFERKILVWTGKYKADHEIPKFVPQDQMERAKNLVRIYGMVGMMFLTLLGCIWMIQSGKRAYERGESLSKMNIEWHKSQKETNDK